MNLKHYYPHITFFIVFMVAAVPMLYYYQRKNPHPRFRPGFGEMSMVSIFAVIICAGMSAGLGTLFRPENDGSMMNKKMDQGAGMFNSGGGQDEGRDKSKDKKKTEDNGDLSGAGFHRE